VAVLREFRDQVLLSNSLGTGLVRFYYEVSPPIADFIAKHDTVRVGVRWSLLPLVAASWMALRVGLVPTLGITLALFGLIYASGMILVRRVR
jgi:hypothetical protein